MNLASHVIVTDFNALPARIANIFFAVAIGQLNGQVF